MSVTKRGYITINETISVSSTATQREPFNLTQPVASTSMRIVVTWDSVPSDLDSYLFIPMSATTWSQVSFDNIGSCTRQPYACYECETHMGYGPETTLIARIKSGPYSFQVGQISAAGSIERTSKARVHIYKGSSLVRIFTPSQTAAPCNGSPCFWAVFSLDGAIGTIPEDNRFYIP